MLDFPLVTVYITNHNYEKYISEAIESVLNQTFDKFELLIIDDGSTDDSIDIIKSYANHPKVRILFQENNGLNKTNNIAINYSSGKYIMRLDADDYLDENALLVLSTALDRNEKISAIFPDYYYIDIYGNVTGQERRDNFEKDVKLFDKPAHGACCMFRKEVLQELNGYSEDFDCQDGYDIWLKLIKNQIVRNINLPLFYYRKHGNSLSDRVDKIHKTRSKIIRKRILEDKIKIKKGAIIIPVLGKKYDKNCLSMENFIDRPVIEWTIDQAIKVENIGAVIVSSPDDLLLEYIKDRYNDKIDIHKRSNLGSAKNIPYEECIFSAIDEYKLKFDEDGPIVILNIESPLRSSIYIDKAINSLYIFNVEIVCAVLIESDLFYKHDGTGLKLICNDYKKMRFERNEIYREVGGMRIFLNKNKLLNDVNELVIGHVITNEESAFRLKSKKDIKLLEAIYHINKIENNYK